jgi:Tol biopolymer transport system component
MRLPPWEAGAPPPGWAERPAYVPTVSIGPAHSYAVFPVGDYKQGMEIWLAPLDTPLAARALVARGPNDESPALSPDAKWLAYVGSATGQAELYVRRVLGKESREQVSEGGAMEPAWSSDGRNLFYRSRGWIWRARIDTGATPLVVRRDSLFPDTFATMGNATNYDVFPGGKSLLMIREQTDTVRMGFATEWPALLRRRTSSP